mmetsp:Transcript_2143/g.4354  ORF Transcript_2143/g.4354 Transcript_2143/m.4354 type:complete len:232 (-) Transcript_2143:172-867(-)|eukprot:CAMPEP_0114253030 /NCGR_PEP_ID=MMETSP0058-20121206/16167_1 /TAXON_ID=36894 /ORGANISM="Pyramimonas parkeae, CCMP726" /LENGTH=231 /DNA_ID=CAMNT_0001367033 /DNA_START=148 /DNA_END=843 /DNA_ORIENTATION=-
MLGFRSRDSWLNEFEEAKRASDETMELLHQRAQLLEGGGADVARLTGTVRRKLSGLKSKLDRLESVLKDQGTITDQEAERRHDMLVRLRTRADQMASMLNRPQDRQRLQSGSVEYAPPRETEQTAELDNAGLVMMQRNIMRDQDDQLEDLSRIVSSTKHISMAIGEEVDLQNSLLEDFEDEMDTSTWRLKTAQRKALELYKKSGTCKYMTAIIILIIALIVVLVLVIKLGS